MITKFFFKKDELSDNVLKQGPPESRFWEPRFGETDSGEVGPQLLPSVLSPRGVQTRQRMVHLWGAEPPWLRHLLLQAQRQP